ncbi:MAG TPA: TetR/AcrR family transcriptional regulator [Thermoleophilaceae bacterium]|nr:TetR/AcrR family transcriptional regulator [Thermoleophilaceae bacterium]
MTTALASPTRTRASARVRPAPAVDTPWGRADTLRQRRLRPGPGTPRDAVTTNQRDRIAAATVAAVADLGYEHTRVADIVALSGVSRSAFYHHFDDKLDCFVDTLLKLRDAMPGDLTGAVEFATTYPAAATLALCETHAAGPRARRVIAGELEVWSRQLEQTWPEVPRDVAYAIAGGGVGVCERRLRRGDPLGDVLGELTEWAESCRSDVKLPRPRRKPRVPAGVTRGDDARYRILAAVTDLVAEVGYQDATIVEVADRASASLSTFYSLFGGKEAAMLSAVHREVAWSLGGGVAADSVYGAIDTMLNYFASEPAAARLVFLEAPAATPEIATRGDVVHRLLRPLVGGARIDASAAAIHALIAREVRAGRADRLRSLTPTATYLAIAPLVGAAQAAAVARQDAPQAVPA